VLQRVTAAEESIEHPMLTVPDNHNDILVVVISSDRGLCGGFNSQLLKFAQKQIANFRSQGKSVKLILFGRKSTGFYKNQTIEKVETHEGNNPENFNGNAKELVETLTTMLAQSSFEKAFVCYNAFQSVMIQNATISQVLPMKLDSNSDQPSSEYLYEPNGTEILGELLPMVLHTQLLQAMLETEAGEQAARMQAMDNATRNAGDLIDKLTLKYNRARQAAITNELIEIISGAEAL
jgi:F-type H+-transporting ATPase subunit gamma